MSYRNWHVGMKVVCVDGGIIDWQSFNDVLPQEGQVYTIRAIRPWVWGMGTGWRVTGIGVWLHEIWRPIGPADEGTEVPYGAERFRPVQKRKTDISQFTAMLNSQPVVKGAREKA